MFVALSKQDFYIYKEAKFIKEKLLRAKYIDMRNIGIEIYGIYYITLMMYYQNEQLGLQVVRCLLTHMGTCLGI